MAKRRNFTPEFKIDKQTHASQQRITQLEQLVGKLTLELDICSYSH